MARPTRRRRGSSPIASPRLFQELIDRLVEASVAYLTAPARAGAEAVQIFDSWAGVLPPAEFERWCLEPMSAIVGGLRAAVPGARHRLSARRRQPLGEIAGIDGLRASASTPPSIRVGGRALPVRSRCKAISIRWRCSPAARALTGTWLLGRPKGGTAVVVELRL